ncbi:hypothetical protein NSK11_contig00056-0007 [Nocardia seriolae]|uniref:Uncharacterized protein n=1 Tax=Nocardia seriolae TaxID=37332 RepID=A0ABC9YVN8_9NOCA|nr:hypothetical protein NSER024013_50370 [Nocardia seriolae]GAP29427.1 hypothetical protein NSK11_contig00056-0007 [Nocardia seriolae]
MTNIRCAGAGNLCSTPQFRTTKFPEAACGTPHAATTPTKPTTTAIPPTDRHLPDTAEWQARSCEGILLAMTMPFVR